MGIDVGAQQVVNTATTAFDRFAVEDLDAHGALLAVNLSVRGAFRFRDEFDPLPGMQGRIDEFGARVSLVVAGGTHARDRTCSRVGEGKVNLCATHISRAVL